MKLIMNLKNICFSIISINLINFKITLKPMNSRNTPLKLMTQPRPF